MVKRWVERILGIHSPSGMMGRVEFLTDKSIFSGKNDKGMTEAENQLKKLINGNFTEKNVNLKLRYAEEGNNDAGKIT